MSDLIRTLSLSASGMNVQSERLRHVAENIANADTPGYRRKLTTFEAERPRDAGGVPLLHVGPVRLDRRDLTVIHDPGHPMADEAGMYNGSNVDLVVEIADARQAQRSYEANLKIFDQARQMTTALFDILRR